MLFWSINQGSIQSSIVFRISVHYVAYLFTACMKVMLLVSLFLMCLILTFNLVRVVTVAANGLQAWKILSDLSNHIDLVLSEVDIPCLSGIALLRNIMKHDIRQHIPVVMMSFSDSISVVFKSLSEGAVDYLLKPVRKNEIKNLWRHIWRRWHSSCGSGSGIGAQPQKTVRLKGVEIFYDDNSGSNNEDDSARFGLNVDGESDNASGTQGSWTKPIVEVNCSCALAICSNFEVFGPEQLPTTATREYQAHKKQLDSGEFHGSSKLLKNLERKKAIDVDKEGTPLHLGVKRRREVEDITTTRYNAASNANKAPCLSKESCSSHDHNSEAVLKDESLSKSMEKCSHSCPALPSMENNLLCAHRVDILEKAEGMAVKEMLVQPIATHQELQIQHLDNCNHHHHLVQNIQQKLPPNHEDLSLKRMAAAAPQSGLSNIFGGPVEGHKGSSVP